MLAAVDLATSGANMPTLEVKVALGRGYLAGFLPGLSAEQRRITVSATTNTVLDASYSGDLVTIGFSFDYVVSEITKGLAQGIVEAKATQNNVEVDALIALLAEDFPFQVFFDATEEGNCGGVSSLARYAVRGAINGAEASAQAKAFAQALGFSMAAFLRASASCSYSEGEWDQVITALKGEFEDTTRANAFEVAANSLSDSLWDVTTGVFSNCQRASIAFDAAFATTPSENGKFICVN